MYKLLGTISKSSEPVIRLKMCSQVISAIETNIYRYRNADISAGEIMEALATVDEIVHSIDTNENLGNKVVRALKDEIEGTSGTVGSLERARDALNNAYPEVNDNE